ncbi:hypothetical protein IPA_07615 [Ignicoccus pacificus DSM 13166]|uniref:Uncharacterized protein n=1 Tax=Ignicoccus pacificus DSM 13166 TaxID=940294 RepID=A0A977KD44_9CREN|nr:hypothetical protein IPA_07615 [Ignicoccus pacificus DSM 13166]
MAMALKVSPTITTMGVGTTTLPLTLSNEEKTPIPLTVMRGGIPISMMVLLNTTTITYTLNPYQSTTTAYETLTFTNEIGLNLTKKITVVYTYPYSIAVSPTTFKYGMANTYTVTLTPAPTSPLTLIVDGITNTISSISTFTLTYPLSSLTMKVLSDAFTLAERTVTLRKVLPNAVLIVTPTSIKGIINSTKTIKTMIINLETVPVTLTVKGLRSTTLTLSRNTTLSNVITLSRIGTVTHTVYLLVNNKTLTSYPYTIRVIKPIEVSKVITIVPRATEIANLTVANNLGKVVTLTLVPINVSVAPLSAKVTLPTHTTVIPLVMVARNLTNIPLQLLYDNTSTITTISVVPETLKPVTITERGSWAYPLTATHTVTVTNTLPISFVATGMVNNFTLGKMILVPRTNHLMLYISPSLSAKTFTLTLRSGNVTLAVIPVRYWFYVPISIEGKVAYVPGLPTKATVTLLNNFTEPYTATLLMKSQTIYITVPPRYTTTTINVLLNGWDVSSIPISVYLNGKKIAEHKIKALVITPFIGIKIVPQTITVPLGISSEIAVELLNPYSNTLTVTLGSETLPIPPKAITLYPVTITPLTEFNGTAYVSVTYLGKVLATATLNYYFIMPYSVSPSTLPYLEGSVIVVPVKVINALKDVIVPLNVLEGTTELVSTTLYGTTTILLPVITTPVTLAIGNWRTQLSIFSITPDVSLIPRITTVTVPIGKGYKVTFTAINKDSWTYLATGYVNSNAVGRALLVPGTNVITLVGKAGTSATVNTFELGVGTQRLLGVIMVVPKVPISVERFYANDVYSYLPASLYVVLSKSARSPATILLLLDGSSREITLLSNRTTVTFERTFTRPTYVTLVVVSSTYTLFTTQSYVSPLEPLTIVPEYAEGRIGVPLTIPITVSNLANTSYYFTLSVSGAYNDWYEVSLSPSATLTTSLVFIPSTIGCNDLYFSACFSSGCTSLTGTCYYVGIPRPIVVRTPTLTIRGIGSNTTLLVLSNPFPVRMVVTLIGDKRLSFPTSVITIEPLAKVAIPVTGTLKYYGYVTATVLITNSLGTLTTVLMKIIAVPPGGSGFEGIAGLIMLAYAIARMMERL